MKHTVLVLGQALTQTGIHLMIFFFFARVSFFSEHLLIFTYYESIPMMLFPGYILLPFPSTFKGRRLENYFHFIHELRNISHSDQYFCEIVNRYLALLELTESPGEDTCLMRV